MDLNISFFVNMVSFLLEQMASHRLPNHDRLRPSVRTNVPLMLCLPNYDRLRPSVGTNVPPDAVIT